MLPTVLDESSCLAFPARLAVDGNQQDKQVGPVAARIGGGTKNDLFGFGQASQIMQEPKAFCSKGDEQAPTQAQACSA